MLTQLCAARAVGRRAAVWHRGRTMSDAPVHYARDLSGMHHRHFGMVARSAARGRLARVSRAGFSSGVVGDLAAGSGILTRAVVEAGFSGWGVDISDEMLAIARAEAPGATFVQGSLWEVELPGCVAVA